jgi:hypothetical protein
MLLLISFVITSIWIVVLFVNYVIGANVDIVDWLMPMAINGVVAFIYTVDSIIKFLRYAYAKEEDVTGVRDTKDFDRTGDE